MDNGDKRLRQYVQMIFAFAFLMIIITYNLYIKEILSFKVISIADLNPYGAWSTLKDWVTDCSFEFDGMTKSIALTIAILAMSVLGGRFLCGWLCPLGALQDFSRYVFKTLIGGKLIHSEHLTSLDYTDNSENKMRWIGLIPTSFFILIILLFISIAGYGATIAELSPWRALLNLPRLFSSWIEIKTGFIVLLAVIITSTLIPRFFCRYICPIGAIQTLFSSFSFLTIKKDKNCTSCNICLKDCPMNIKLSKKEDNISPECIRCMNCVGGCVISNDRSLTLKAGTKQIKTKTYTAFMLSEFFIIWLGLPKLWTNSSMVSNISVANLKNGVYRGEAKGFAARIITEVKIENGIKEIKIIDHHESKGWYDEVFLKLPKEIIKKQKLEVDAISGATKTSKGLIRSIENALKKAIN
ncbi:MAG: 4Fe-4S binding protein [Clostridiales bacterium]|nr:4Fe-4S binding protein [Clostridiales bacterium]